MGRRFSFRPVRCGGLWRAGFYLGLWARLFLGWSGLAALAGEGESGLAPAKQVAGQQRAVFVYYNVRNYRVGPGEREGRLLPVKPEEERARVARILADLQPDMVGLAEIADGTALADLQERLRALGRDLPHAVLLEGPDTERRLAFLSQWPVVADDSQRRLGFELAGTPQWVQRGVLDVTVELPAGGGKVRWVGLHLKSPRETPALEAAALRAREVRAVRQHLEKVWATEANTPLFVWGDLNMTRHEAAWGVLVGEAGSAHRLRAVPLRDALGTTWTYHWPEADIYARIDFILASRTAKHLVVEDCSGLAHPPDWPKASDHRPLFLTLSW